MTKSSSQFIKAGSFQVELVHLELTSNTVNSYENTYISSATESIPTRIGIILSENGRVISSALIGAEGRATGIHQTSHIVEDEKMVICCADSIFCISIPELKLLWSTKADTCTCFQVFKHHDDYIVHGETEILRLDSLGKLLWQNGGANIFTTSNGKDHFKITEAHIEVCDWNNHLYIFGFDGTLLSHEPR